MGAVKVNWMGLRAKLGDLTSRLRDVASGGVYERAAAKVQSQIDAASKRILAQHVYTGNALATSTATRGGQQIQLTTARYLKFHEWWPFRSGMPPFVMRNAIKVFSAELKAALAGDPSPLLVAEEEAIEAAERKRAAAEDKQRKREEKERDRRLDAAAKEREREQRHNARIAKIRARGDIRAAKAKLRRERQEERVVQRSRETFKRVTARIARRQARDAARAAKAAA